MFTLLSILFTMDTSMKQLTKRNEFIIKLSREGHGTRTIQDRLVEEGYENISRNRIWYIMRRSPHYIPRNKSEKFCNFCLENKPTNELHCGKKGVDIKVTFRMCDDCLKRLTPEQPKDQN